MTRIFSECFNITAIFELSSQLNLNPNWKDGIEFKYVEEYSIYNLKYEDEIATVIIDQYSNSKISWNKSSYHNSTFLNIYSEELISQALEQYEEIFKLERNIRNFVESGADFNGHQQ